MSDEHKLMTQEELAEIRELAEKATPGPWYGYLDYKENMIEAKGAKWVMGLSPTSCPFTESIIKTCGEDAALSFECPTQVLISPDNLDYIVAANPKTVLALLAEVERLRKMARYIAEQMVHDGGAGFRWAGAFDGDGMRMYKTKEEAIQSWLDEASREVSDAK